MSKSKHLYLLLLILFTAFAYLNSFNNSFVWDDFNTIVNNDLIKGPLKLADIFFNSPGLFYRPLPMLTIIFDYALWGMNTFGYHLTNFLFHLFNVTLIFYLAQRITRHLRGSFICALLFAIHPIHTEAVTYISGRSDLICAFFLLSSFYLYLGLLDAIRDKKKFYPVRDPYQGQDRRLWRLISNGVYLFVSLLLFSLAMLSKESALLFPLLLFGYNLCFLKSSLRDKFKPIIPFILLTITFLLVRYFFITGDLVPIAIGNLKIIFRLLLFYLGLLVFPINLHMQHSLRENIFLHNMPFYLSAIIFLGFIFTILKLAKKRYILFGLWWFIMGLLPFLGILKLNAEIAEHWLYLPSFGFFLLAGRFFNQNKFKINKIALPTLVVILTILTIQRNSIWHDDISIYQDTLKYHFGDPKLHYNLGNAYLRQDMLLKARKEYLMALRLNPNYAYASHNLGIVLENQGNLKEKEYFDHSLYAEVLDKFLKDGQIDYLSLKKDRRGLDAYLRKVAGLEPETLKALSTDEKIAFYLNIYNALTLKVIADHYPVKSIKDIPGVWDKFKFEVAGRKLTLNQIEHQILRKEFKEPRIHFALVCASKSCPELASEPFSGKVLDEQLDREAHKFINDKTKVRLDRSNRTLYISSIFKWFRKDFGDVIKFIGKYLPEDEAKFIVERNPKIRYLHYDWSLNEKL